MMGITMFFICNILLILSTYGYVKLLKSEKPAYKIIDGFIIYFIRIIAYMLFLGYVVKKLNYSAVTILSLIEFVIMYIIFKIKKIDLFKEITNSLVSLFNKKIEIKLNLNMVLFIIFLITFIVMAFVGMVVYEYSWDGCYYHLPQLIDYIQDGEIGITNNTLWNNVYPQSIEFISMFFMMFTKTITFARLPQLLSTLLGMIVIYNLMKKMKFSKNVSFRCSLLYFVIPFVLTQITTTYIDSTMITMFFVLIYYLYNIFEENKFKDELMFVLCLAIFIGIKGTCLIYGGIFAITYGIYKIYLCFKKKEKITILIAKVLLFISILVLIGCYWLIQNIVVYGNPLHPFKFLWIDGMDSYVDIGKLNEPLSIKKMNTVEQILVSWTGLAFGDTRYDNGYNIQNLVQMHDSRIGALGIQWLYFLIPLTIIAVIFICKKKYKLEKKQIILLVLILICYLVSPGKWWGRYTGFIALIGYIGYGIFEQNITNNKIKKIVDVWFTLIFILSIPLSAGYAIFNLENQKPYPAYDRGFYEYMALGEPKNTLCLQQEYGEDTQSYVFIKGKNFQNNVDFYYLDEMYPNVKATNHNIKTYENFEKIANNRIGTEYIVVFEKEKNRDNSLFAKKYVDEKWNYEQLDFGEKIVVYHKLDEK